MIELDYCVAGVVWRDGPLSAYRVREHFRVSMTPAWSSSCGTIYPVIHRLVANGLITAANPTSRRGTRLLEVTEQGKETVTKWMLRIGPDTAAPVPDPIRTRLQFLLMLPQDAVDRFIADAIAATQQSVDRLVESLSLRFQADRIDFLATLGSIHQLKGRITWLKAIQPALKDRSGKVLDKLLREASKKDF